MLVERVLNIQDTALLCLGSNIVGNPHTHNYMLMVNARAMTLQFH